MTEELDEAKRMHLDGIFTDNPSLQKEIYKY